MFLSFWRDLLHLESKRAMRILDFDVECRPMAWYGGDWVTKEITAIAWRFVDEPEEATQAWLLAPSRTWEQHQNKKLRGMKKFLKAFKACDIVTGHYIRGFDLPLVNGTCIRLGLPPLQQKLVHDTKVDLVRMSGLSKSQENLAAYFEMKHQKEKMNTHLWEIGNSLVEEGRVETLRRVVGDVNQHIEFRQELIKRGALQPTSMWTSGARAEKYHA